jgi:hypothetical protein
LRREGKWSWELELWRLALQLAVLTSTGYFWGVTSFEWIVVRACLLAYWAVPLARRAWNARAHASTPANPAPAPRSFELQVDGSKYRALIPIAISLALLAVESRWFWALYQEVRGLPQVPTGLGWFTSPLLILMPFWRPEWLTFGRLLPRIELPHGPETVITIGWFLVIPLALALFAVRRRRGGPGIGAVLPFALFFFFGILYLIDGFPRLLHESIPFMGYFRVASRWGLFFPQLAVVLIALSWPELSRIARGLIARAWGKAAVITFAVSSVIELQALLLPVNALPPLPEPARAMLSEVAEAPGTTVLDLPFCVAGGNGICTEEQCPQYPRSIAGLCLRQWHGKKVYGLYHPRMLPDQCEYYRKAPFQSWFQAWRERRCFNPEDWKQFCGYLETRSELSAILLYPEMWEGASKPECLAEFSARLGPPLGSAEIATSATRGGQGTDFTRILRFNPRCLK